MKKFCIKSLGCKQNQLEGQIIKNQLLDLGYSTADIKDSNIYIINSCTVTSHTDSEVNYLINQAKKINPKIKVVLTGCCAQTYKEHSGFDYSRIDLVLGNSEKMNIEDYIDLEGFFVEDIFLCNQFENKFLYNPDSTRVSVKIQDGCNNRCSYCIIPYARGKNRSNSIDNILKQIDILTKKNIKEIVLTGIHIGQWGLDFNKNLIDLLEVIETSKIERYRLGSLYINELDNNLLDFLAQSSKFCEHFHLSLQSLCDKTLKAMNRSYTAQEALDKIELIKRKFHLPFLGCDIIVGFPEESQEDFNCTYQNLIKARVSSIHCFPYSRRENTPAYNMPQVQDSIKSQRADKIISLSQKLHKEFLDLNQQETKEVLIQKRSPKTGLYSAISRNYIKIYIKDNDPNLRHSLRMVDFKDYKLM